MTLPGSVGVSPTGAATYTIPISVPPGTAGITPSLSIGYSSQNGNGTLGAGWTLNGLPTITRCGRNVAQDGVRAGVKFDVNDRFCLDGEKLFATAGTYGADGTEYHTEVENFSKVVSRGAAGVGPGWFQVWTKNGRLLEFGNTADSRAVVQGTAATREWLVNKISDVRGNYVSVTYSNNATTGEVYPTRIDYTGNTLTGLVPYNSIQFQYSTRPDAQINWVAGASAKSTKLLTNVQTFQGASMVLDYRLSYQTSAVTNRQLLSSITLCEATTTTCSLAPTSFTYQASTSATSLVRNMAFPTNPPTGGNMTLTGDINGSGRTGAVIINFNDSGVPNAPNPAYLTTLVPQADGSFSRVQQQLSNVLYSCWDYSTDMYSNSGCGNGFDYIFSGDFNGDGKLDFAIVVGNTIVTYFGNGNGTFSTSNANGVPLLSGYPYSGFGPARTFVADFDGDGKADIGFVSCAYNGTNCKMYAFLSNGNGTFHLPATGSVLLSPTNPSWNLYSAPFSSIGDFNGDGMVDLIFVDGSTYYMFLGNGDGTFKDPLTSKKLSPTNPSLSFNTLSSFRGWNFFPTDMNGDGTTDLVFSGGNSVWTFLSKGDGNFVDPGQSSVLSPSYPAFDQIYYSSGYMMDPCNVALPGSFLNSGRTDLMFICGANNSVYVFPGNGDGTFRDYRQADLNLIGENAATGYYYSSLSAVADFNGDGKADLMFENGARMFMATNPNVDALVSVNPGLGLSTTFTYKPLTDSTVYTKSTGSVFPLVDWIAPAWVVSRMDAPNGQGGTIATGYSYAGAKMHMSGRGLLGFATVKQTDLQTNITNTTNYRQDHPFIGLVSSQTKSLNSQILTQVTNTYGSTALGGSRYQVYLTQSQTATNDLNGTAMPSATSTFQYDAYGNATQVQVTSSDGFVKTTTNTYSNDPTKWILGRLLTATVTSQSP